DRDALAAAMRPETRMIWIETPSNPMLKLVDLAMVAELGREHGLVTVADNTFASPYVQRPLELGFDVVMHSATKYLNGHSDMVGGVVVIGDNRELGDQLAFLQNAVGAVAGPLTASSRCAASRPWRCGWSGIAPTRSPSPSIWRLIRASRAYTIPGCRAIGSMRSPAGRCTPLAGW